MYFVNKQFLALLTFKSFRLHRLLWIYICDRWSWVFQIYSK